MGLGSFSHISYPAAKTPVTSVDMTGALYKYHPQFQAWRMSSLLFRNVSRNLLPMLQYIHSNNGIIHLPQIPLDFHIALGKRHGITVMSCTGHGIDGITDRYNPCSDRNLFCLKPGWIARASGPLMMMQHNVIKLHSPVGFA